jgi:SAM-dependent methyltransferase
MSELSAEESRVRYEGREYRVIEDPVYGYRRLDPIPDAGELARFYQSHYYHLIRQGGRAHELKHLMEGGEAAERERSWLEHTLYSDLAHALETHAPGQRVLDVGCGTGEALAFLKRKGFSTIGVEPSAEASQAASGRGIDVLNMTLEEYVEHRSATRAPAVDAVLLLCVLEHVPDPAATIVAARSALVPGGLIGIRVPNDFNDIQRIARDKLAKSPWWIAVPDHINYFTFASLRSFLDRLGFDVVYEQGDFPMELFLLMGDDYVGDEAVGSACHQKRVRFETALPPALRRRMYQAMASAGLSRDCLVFGRLRD